MDSIQQFKTKLSQLEALLGQLKSSHARVQQLKRSVYVLRVLLNDHENIKSPYGPHTAIVQFSLQ
jgi:hypothetical protein